jgi:glyoxalase family protein
MALISGIHHITAIAGDPQENIDFYTGVLGMRLVKRSVNQDSPDTYHFFYADGEGHPGTDITFFPWPRMPKVIRGSGQWDEVYLGINPGTISYWEDRLNTLSVPTDRIRTRFGEKVLPFSDPHGMRLALLESKPYPGFVFSPWEKSPVPSDRQINSLAGVRLVERSESTTGDFLNNVLGFSSKESESGWTRYILGKGDAGQRIDIKETHNGARGGMGIGGVHHVAWRVGDRETQEQVRIKLSEAGARPTEIIDRFWFQSVYALEPGGALVEIATDGPGFGVDEDMNHLGETLVLPSWLETRRYEIENALTPVSVPGIP